MMPVAGNLDTPPQLETVDYKKKYKTLKRKLKFLVYEHECFLEELRKAQRKLLKVTRDRSFLLDRLIQYERTDDSSSDSEATFSSDSEAEAQKDGTSVKKKKTEAPLSMFGTSVLLSNLGYSPAVSGQPAGPPGNMPQSAGQKASEPAKKRAKVSKKASQATLGQTAPKQTDSHPQQQPGHMTREELERHLEMKQSTRPQFMSIDKTPNTLPDDIFNNENSNPDSDIGVERVKQEPPDDSDLVIDVPQD